MENDKENSQRPQPVAGSAEDPATERKEQFNELSELSLEERMAVADRLGIPTAEVREGVALGTATSNDDAAQKPEELMEREDTGEELNR